MKEPGWWASEVFANVHTLYGVSDVVRMIQADAISRAADHAEKTADSIGQDDPRTGELSDDDMHRAEGAYQVAERLRLLATETSKPNRSRSG